MIKNAIYSTVSHLRASAWKIQGRRRLHAMGVTLDLCPATEFPSSWRYRLPEGHWKDRIVRYGDFVQMHAVCQAISTLERPSFVVDVGAYHGAYAVLMGKLLGPKGGRVLALEPNPDSYSVMKNNIRLNRLEDVVFAERVAVGEHSGEVCFSTNSSQTQLVDKGTGKEGEFRVRMERMETLLARVGFSKVDLLMVDVEGAELQVLRGFPWERMLCPKIFCELHPEEWFSMGYSGKDLIGFLKQHRLRCLDMFMEEHRVFPDHGYLGPCLLLPET